MSFTFIALLVVIIAAVIAGLLVVISLRDRGDVS